MSEWQIVTDRIRNSVLPVIWGHVQAKENYDGKSVQEPGLDKHDDHARERWIHDNGWAMLERFPNIPNSMDDER